MFIDQELFSRIFGLFRSENYIPNSFVFGEKKSTSKQVLLDLSKNEVVFCRQIDTFDIPVYIEYLI